MKTKLSTAVLAALVCAPATPLLARAEDWPTCQEWQAKALDTPACVCGDKLRVQDDRKKACDQAVGPAGLAKEPPKAPSAMETRMQGVLASAEMESKFGFKGLEVGGGLSRSGQAGNGPSFGGSVTYFQTKHFSLDAGYIRHVMRENQTDLSDAGPNPMGGPDLQALSVTRPKITWNSIAGFNYHPHDLGPISPYARVEGGYVGVPGSVNVHTQIVAGGQVVQDMGYSMQPTGNGTYGAAAVGGGAEISPRKDSRFAVDVRVMHVPQLGTYPTVQLKIKRFRKRKDDSK